MMPLEQAPEQQAPLDQLAAALAAFQAEMPTVPKSQTARVRTRDGDSYSYTYAGLADVTEAAMPLLAKHGLAFATLPGDNQLTGMLIHQSGQALTAALPIHGTSPQQVGSSLTYMRRYLLGCMTGLVTDDDDDGRQAETRKRTSSDTSTQPRKTVRTRARQAAQDAGRVETISEPDRPPVAPVSPPYPTAPQAGFDAPRPINSNQRGQVMAACSRIGIDPDQDREMRLALFSALLAKPVGSVNDLSYSEANTVLRYLNDIETGALEWDYLVPQNAVQLRWARDR
jgi:hypothetical protein